MHRRLAFHSTNSLYCQFLFSQINASFSQISQNSRKVGTFTDPGYTEKSVQYQLCILLLFLSIDALTDTRVGGELSNNKEYLEKYVCPTLLRGLSQMNEVRPQSPVNWLAGLATYSNFFLFPCRKKSLICLEGKSMNPCRGNAILFRSSQQLPCLRLGPSKGFLS